MNCLQYFGIAIIDAFRLAVVYCVRACERLLFWLPLRQNRVIFYLHARRGYTCNLKAILETFLYEAKGQHDLVWVTKWPEPVRHLERRGVKVVKLYSLRHFWMQLTAKVIFISDAFPHLIRIRRGQITINAWHGGMNYKHIGIRYCKFKNIFRRIAFAIANQQPTYFISGSQFFTKDTSHSFNFEPSIFLPIGLPRNDMFFVTNETIKKKVFTHYRLQEGTRVVLFAPTFREGMCNAQCHIDFDVLTKTLAKRFGGNWVVFYRAHYFVQAQGVSEGDKSIINVSQYEDMNELLVATDVVISDYSSCLWDFALTKRPSFVYAPDIEDYQSRDRSFACPPQEWPYSISTNEDMLYRAILDFDERLFEVRLSDHMHVCGSYDSGDSSMKVALLILKNT